MRSVEDIRPRSGLSVPVVTVLDESGALDEESQRAVVRHVIQDGYGADVVFAAGTTGEWDRIEAGAQRRVIQLCAEEVAKAKFAGGDVLGMITGVLEYATDPNLVRLINRAFEKAQPAVVKAAQAYSREDDDETWTEPVDLFPVEELAAGLAPFLIRMMKRGTSLVASQNH